MHFKFIVKSLAVTEYFMVEQKAFKNCITIVKKKKATLLQNGFMYYFNVIYHSLISGTLHWIPFYLTCHAGIPLLQRESYPQ